jgi:ATP-dependent protease ClpP protease subunit
MSHFTNELSDCAIGSSRPNRTRALRAMARISRLTTGTNASPRFAERDSDTLRLALTGRIGDPKQGFTAEQVKAALRSHRRVDFIEIEINSDGGSTPDAFAIHEALKAHPAFVITRADEMCASAATIVLTAGDHREAYPGTKLLLHRAEIVPPSNARWTASAHKQRAESLRRTDARIAAVYSACAGGNRPLFEREMESETFLPLGIAKSWGLIHCLAGEAQWRAGRPYYF